MSAVVDIFRSLLPSKAKSSPSGWTSFNAPCCHHRGHSQDKRKRAGVRFDSGIVYNCFNCKYTTGWQPGSPFGEKMKSLCRWLGANEDTIKELVFESLKTESPDYNPTAYQPKIDFTEKELPEAAMPIKNWIDSEFFPDVAENIEKVANYIYDRNLDPMSGDFYWSPSAGYENRVILPFRYQGKIVGNTARKIVDGKPKYLSDQHPHFVYNLDAQNAERKYMFVVEGPFDALSIGGVAVLTNTISDLQSMLINKEQKKIIVIPDQDKAGLEMIECALQFGYAVAFPNWEDDIKDCAEAVKKYGKLFVIVDAIKTATDNKIKIEMFKKQFEKKIG